MSTRKACHLAQFFRSTYCRKSQARDQSVLRRRIREIAQARPRFGYQRIHRQVTRAQLVEGLAGVARVGAGSAAPMLAPLGERCVDLLEARASLQPNAVPR